MSREYPQSPIPAVGVLIRRGDAILLARRSNEPGKGLWSIPGGIIEIGEKSREAAVREVKEETGLTVEIDSVLEVVDNIVRDDSGRIRFHYVIIEYLARSESGEPQAASDVSEARWVPIGELKSYPLTKSLKLLLTRLKWLD
jgi:8-oxo-dGTP diphosphatase